MLADARRALERLRTLEDIQGATAAQQQRRCIVCYDDFDAAGGVACELRAHFLCDDCLRGLVTAAVDANALRLLAEGAGVRCPDPGCASLPYTDRALARHLPDATFALYYDSKQKLSEQRIYAELERGFEERLQLATHATAALEDEIACAAAARKHITDNILLLACPRCGQAFVDFDACFALNCSRCACAFCAYCLADCGRNAHRHVANCEHNIAPGRDVFASAAVFAEAQRMRRTHSVCKYLATLPASIRARVELECAPDLRDLNIRLGLNAEKAAPGIKANRRMIVIRRIIKARPLALDFVAAAAAAAEADGPQHQHQLPPMVARGGFGGGFGAAPQPVFGGGGGGFGAAPQSFFGGFDSGFGIAPQPVFGVFCGGGGFEAPPAVDGAFAFGVQPPAAQQPLVFGVGGDGGGFSIGSNAVAKKAPPRSKANRSIIKSRRPPRSGSSEF